MKGKAKSRFNSLLYILPLLLLLVYALKKAETVELSAICTSFNGIFNESMITQLYKSLWLFFVEAETIPTSSIELVVINILSYATMVMILQVVFNLLAWLISFTNPGKYSKSWGDNE